MQSNNTKNAGRPKVVNGFGVRSKVTSKHLPTINAIIKHLNEFERNGESYDMKLNNQEIFLINEFVEQWNQ